MDEQKRETLLEKALAELKAFKNKYGMLSELSGLFTAIDNVTDVKKEAS